jgi:F-box and WD-40 domain protein 1/11
LFLGRWRVDLRRASPGNHERARNVRITLGRTWDTDFVDFGTNAKRLLGLSASTDISGHTPMKSAPLLLDWRILYRDRLELDLRWSGAMDSPIFVDTDASRLGRGSDHNPYFLSAGNKDHGAHRWEPKLTRISGHFDR